jgi:hypothetical protein
MKQYQKIIDGKPVVKLRNQIVVRKDGKQIINPCEETILEDGWKEYVIPEPTIDDYRRKKKNEILRYDSSEEVNQFTVQGKKVWLDKATRAGLKLRFESESALGDNETTLWYKNMQFQLSIEQAIRMLYVIEKYASACYDNTQKHLAAVDLLEDINAIQAYNYREGYPDKLEF